MQVLISVIDDTAGFATASQAAAIDVFDERLRTDGYWVFAGGLGGTTNATTIDSRGEAPLVVDGPFVETKEHLAGFWILEVPDLETAIRLGTEASRACDRKIEVRPFLREEDVPDLV